MKKLRAILFDLDGVLVDAKDWHYEALNKALSEFGHEISRDDHLNIYDGLPTKKKLELLSKIKGLALHHHEAICQLKQKYTVEQIVVKCKPRSSHETAIRQLKMDGYKLAVCSNSIRQSVELMLEKSHIKQYFDLILSNQDVVHPKPNPEIYLTCMRKLSVSPDETLILEDNENGIQAALASGAHLMRIDSIEEVHYDNITQQIKGESS